MSATTVTVGVYVNEHRNTALVFAVRPDGVYYLSMETGSIEAHGRSVARFTHEYTRHLPHYPLRRAARIYDASTLEKTPQARKVLRHLRNA